MKILAAILAAALLLPPTTARADQAAGAVVRVLTYNIRHGEGRDGKVDLARQAAVMAAASPDVIALQEVDRGTARSGGVDQLQELARLLGMHAEYGRTMSVDGGEYGIAILSRWPLLGPDTQRLPGLAGREPRAALTVMIRCGRDGPLVQVTSTHLDNTRDASDRMVQASYLERVLAVGAQPSILAGDFNARWDTDVMRVFTPRWVNPAQGEPLPSPGPDGRVRGRPDYVLFRPHSSWRVVESTVLDDNFASDHRPVLTVLEWLGTS